MAQKVNSKKTPSPERKAVLEAERRLERAQEDLARWEHQASQYQLNLADAERSLGEKVVEGVPEGTEVTRASTKDVVKEAADNLSSLRAKVETAEAASETARQRIDKMQRAVWMAQADELSARAKRQRGRAAKRQARTDELLAELREYEGVNYVPNDSVRSLNLPMNAAGEVHYIPKTLALLQDAAGLEAQAQNLQERAANTPDARAEGQERERKAREETIASINADNRRKRDEWERNRVVPAPLGAGPS